MERGGHDLGLCAVLAGWAEKDLETLAGLGWTATKLATLRGCSKNVLEKVLNSAHGKREGFGQDADGLRQLIDQCDNRSANIHRADAGRGSQDLLEAHIDHQREKRRRTFENLEELEVADKIKLVGTAKVTKWPTRLGKKPHLAGGDLALREQAEKTERDRWLAELRDIMKKARLPVALRSSEDSIMMRIYSERTPSDHVEKACQNLAESGAVAGGDLREAMAYIIHRVCRVFGGHRAGAMRQVGAGGGIQDSDVLGVCRRGGRGRHAPQVVCGEERLGGGAAKAGYIGVAAVEASPFDPIGHRHRHGGDGTGR